MTHSLPTSADPTTETQKTLQEYRNDKELTQQELANITGLSIGSIREWEQGVRKTMYSRNWHKLCDALEVDPEVGFKGLTRTFNR